MKLLVVSHTYVTPMNQRKVNALVSEFDEVHLLTPKKVKDTLRTIPFTLLEDAKFYSHTISSYLDYHNAFRVYDPVELYNCLKTVQPDVVLLEQEPYSFSTYQVCRLKKKFEFKLILFSFQNILKKYPFPFSMFESKCLKASDHLIVGNNLARNVWSQKGFELKKMSVLPQVGIDLNEFFPFDAAELKYKYNLGSKVIGFAGRFVEEKGIEVLMKAFSMIPNYDMTLVLVGRGPERKSLEEAAERLHISSRVRFIEGVSHEEMPRIMNMFDVLVLPSLTRKHWREQFGHVLIEALACGVPCVGTDVDPINEIISDCGEVFAEASPDELEKKILKIFERQKQEDISKKCIDRVEKKYTNAVIAKEIGQLCRSLKHTKKPEIKGSKPFLDVRTHEGAV